MGTSLTSDDADSPERSAAASDTGPRSVARQALQGVPWLRDVPEVTLDALAGQSVMHRVPAGSQLFGQAETPVFAQFLLGGSIELLGVRGSSETLVELMRPVDLIVPAAIINDQPYLMRARVYEEAHLLLVRAEAFRDAIGADHVFCRAVLGCIAAQFRRQVRMQKNLKLRSAEERVGCYLVGLLQQSGEDGQIRLPIEKRLIASQLGMTRETFSRALAGMAKFGLRVAGDIVHADDPVMARARFALDPLIDGIEPVMTLPPRTS